MKETICTATGIIGAWIISLLGGWNTALGTLIIFMTTDFIMGLIVAGVFKKSKKTESGALSSRAGFKGFCKKIIMLVFVIIGCRLDMLLEVNYVKNAVIIGLITNELISIVENAGLMGLPMLPIITTAIDILRNKGDNNNGN